MREKREFDVILWGATGFTGQLVAEYIVGKYGVGSTLRWALAGRNLQKLEKVRDALAGIHPDASELELLLGDGGDLESLRAITIRAEVICTTVGPFAKYGSKLVQACVEEGTHYCDITGEVPWVRQMIERHHEEAKEKKLRIVPFCGFDSLPSDLGCLMMQDAMQEAHGVACDEIKYLMGPAKGAVSGGTLATMMNMFEEARKDRDVRRALGNPYALNPKDGVRGLDGSDQNGVRWDADAGVWTGPFVMAGTNTRVVRRTNALLNYRYGEQFRYSEVMRFSRGIKGWVRAVSASSGLGIFAVLVMLSWTRKLLQKTVLPAPGEGPSRELQEKGFFSTFLIGKAGDLRLYGFVKGEKDPGYGATAIMLSESAICLALDQPSLPQQYGVVTSASAMGQVLIKRLKAAGMSFETSAEPIPVSRAFEPKK